MNEIYIYTDCSYYFLEKRLKWAGVILTDKQEYVLSKHTTNEELGKEYGIADYSLINQHFGEFHAILTSLKKILKNKYNGLNRVVLYTDSENAFEAIYGVRALKKNKSLKVINSQCQQVVDSFKSAGIDLEICWVPGHSGICGNVIANKWTNKKSANKNEIVPLLSGFNGLYKSKTPKVKSVNSVIIQPVLNEPPTKLEKEVVKIVGLEKGIRRKMLAIKENRMTPKESNIGILFKQLESRVKMKKEQSSLHKSLVQEYKLILNKTL